MTVVDEKAEQIYQFQLFTKEYCDLLIEEVEHCGRWITQDEEFKSVNINGLEEIDDPETTLHLHEILNLEEVFYEYVDKHLKPVMEALWITFKLLKKDRPYVLKYEPHVIKEMGLHYDNETVTLVCNLNEEYEGGGTYFPRWNFSTGKPPAGGAIIYPGGVSHQHQGLKITAGKRYLFLCAFY